MIFNRHSLPNTPRTIPGTPNSVIGTPHSRVSTSTSTLFTKNDKDITVSVRLKSPASWNVIGSCIYLNDSQYDFDHILTMKNSVLYQECCKPTLDRVLNGQNATIICYGATNSGKTYTMYGSEQHPGIVPLTLDYLFKQPALLFKISFFEIYNENIRDLLQQGEVVKVTSKHHVNILFQKGNSFKRTEQTEFNINSSRSHVIFQLYITFINQNSCVLNLIDLAGSEKLCGSNVIRRQEGSYINKSLLTLGTVISKLGSLKGHIPFRDSKLTKILQPFLSSATNINVILTLGETMQDSTNTLNFGLRLLKIKPRRVSGVGLDPLTPLIKRIQELEDTLEQQQRDFKMERDMWEQGLFEIQHEKQEISQVCIEARSRLCKLLDIDQDSFVDLDALIDKIEYSFF